MSEARDRVRQILQIATLSAAERWEQVLAVLETTPDIRELATIDTLLHEAPDFPPHVRRAPKR